MKESGFHQERSRIFTGTRSRFSPGQEPSFHRVREPGFQRCFQNLESRLESQRDSRPLFPALALSQVCTQRSACTQCPGLSLTLWLQLALAVRRQTTFFSVSVTAATACCSLCVAAAAAAAGADTAVAAVSERRSGNTWPHKTGGGVTWCRPLP